MESLSVVQPDNQLELNFERVRKDKRLLYMVSPAILALAVASNCKPELISRTATVASSLCLCAGFIVAMYRYGEAQHALAQQAKRNGVTNP